MYTLNAIDRFEFSCLEKDLHLGKVNLSHHEPEKVNVNENLKKLRDKIIYYNVQK